MRHIDSGRDALKVENLESPRFMCRRTDISRLRARTGHSRSEKTGPPTFDAYHETGQIHTITGCSRITRLDCPRAYDLGPFLGLVDDELPQIGGWHANLAGLILGRRVILADDQKQIKAAYQSGC
jgi:hypothetical protein